MAKYITRVKNYKMIMVPSARTIEQGRPIIHYGKSIQFENGEYTTKNKAEIDFLKNHSDNGRLFYEEKEKISSKV